MTFDQALDLLMKGGFFTISLGEAWVIRYLYIEHKKENEKHAAEKQQLNDRIISNTAEQTKLLTEVNSNQKMLVEALRDKD